MPTYVAFLRAVNVGQRQYPMAELRDALTAAGFEDVETHIQTGNVRVRTGLRSPAKVVAALEQTMLADRGFEVRVVLMTPQELRSTYAEALRLAGDRQLTGHHLTLLAEPPDAGAAAALEASAPDDEIVRVGARAVHLMLPDKGYGRSVTSNARVERHLGVATTRSLTVVGVLSERWGA